MESDESTAFFAALEIEADLAWDVFKLIDTDEGGSLDIDEFVTGCLRLRGPAKSLDVAKLHYMCKRLDKMLVFLVGQNQQQMVEVRKTLTLYASERDSAFRGSVSAFCEPEMPQDESPEGTLQLTPRRVEPREHEQIRSIAPAAASVTHATTPRQAPSLMTDFSQ